MVVIVPVVRLLPIYLTFKLPKCFAFICIAITICPPIAFNETCHITTLRAMQSFMRKLSYRLRSYSDWRANSNRITVAMWKDSNLQLEVLETSTLPLSHNNGYNYNYPVFLATAVMQYA